MGKPSHLHKRLHDLLRRVRKVRERVITVIDPVKLDPIKKKKLVFPSVLFPKKNVALEWWYFSGHIHTKERSYGYCLTFFKVHPHALHLHGIPLHHNHTPFLIVHSSLADQKRKKFTCEENHPKKQEIHYTKLYLVADDNRLIFDPKGGFEISCPAIGLRLHLQPQKPLIKHFQAGFRTQHDEQRTYYLSYSRLQTSGTLKKGARTLRVSGESWFDHQKVNNIPSHFGWTWFSILLNDNTELMLYTLQDQHGLIANAHIGTYINRQGKQRMLSSKDFHVKAYGHWTSPTTGITYPSKWRITIAPLDISLTVTPFFHEQEFKKTWKKPFSYWEGTCRVQGTKRKKRVRGNAYTEITGYDQGIGVKILRTLLG